MDFVSAVLLFSFKVSVPIRTHNIYFNKNETNRYLQNC